MATSKLQRALISGFGIAALLFGFASAPAHGAKADTKTSEAEMSPPAQTEFPPHAEVEFERSVIRIPIRFTGDTEPQEIVELTAFMRLEREAPVRNTIGYRQFEFTIRNWELFGYSEVLGAHISFVASPDVVQPKSLCVALQKDSDYPALIVYNAIYDIYIDGRKIISQRPGVAMARGVVEIPPRNITVAFQKPFAIHWEEHDDEREVVFRQHGDCTGSSDYRCTIFDPGTCDDMSPIAEAEFEAGLREAKAIREDLATLKPKPSKERTARAKP